jgi:outer membrane lipoprotein SlyB
MKKFLATILAMIMMVGLVPVLANAQSYTYQRVYSNGRYRYVRVYKKRSFYKRHRKVINTAIGTGAGAGLGAVIGGKKGAVIGGLLGAGGATVYNLKTRKKRRY